MWFLYGITITPSYLILFCRSVISPESRQMGSWQQENPSSNIILSFTILSILHHSRYKDTTNMHTYMSYIILFIWDLCEEEFTPDKITVLMTFSPHRHHHHDLLYTSMHNDAVLRIFKCIYIWQYYPNTHKHSVHLVKIHIRSSMHTVQVIPNYK